MIAQHDNVVIGSSLSAVIFAYLYDYPLFFTTPCPPLRFDYFESRFDFAPLGLDNLGRQLKTLDGAMKIGTSKLLLWERVIFLLSLKGLLPLSDLCVNIRDDGEKVVCTDEYSKIYEFNFSTCYYFGDSGALNIAAAVEHTEEYICYDYIAFHKGGKHDIDYIHTFDDFAGEIWFYSSDRIDGNTGVKDACVVSRLTKEQLMDPNYSETMARFKMEKIIKDKGMKGPINGYTATGKPKYYNFKTSHCGRNMRLATSTPYIASPSILTEHPAEEELVAKLLTKGLSRYGSLKCEHTLRA